MRLFSVLPALLLAGCATYAPAPSPVSAPPMAVAASGPDAIRLRRAALQKELNDIKRLINHEGILRDQRIGFERAYWTIGMLTRRRTEIRQVLRRLDAEAARS